MARTWRYCPVIRLKRNLVDGLGVERQSPLMRAGLKKASGPALHAA
jgi:hypothetical protein